MPVFVFVSGYFYKKESDYTDFGSFIKKKFLRLVVPYFLWNIFYGIFNFFFRKIGIIEYGDPINLNSLFIRPWIDGHQFHFNIPAWFILSLFLVEVFTYALRKFMIAVHILNEELLLIITFIISIISIFYAENGYNTGWYLCLAKFGVLLPYLQMGFVYKKYEEFLNRYKAAAMGIIMCCIYILLVLSKGNAGVSIVFARFNGNPFIITGLMILSILMTATISDILAPAFRNNRLVKTIGDNTFTIMMHHPIIIFSINLIIYIMTKFVGISGFNTAEFKSTLWYTYPWRDSRIFFFYVIIAISMPLIIKFIFDKIFLHIYNRSDSKN